MSHHRKRHSKKYDYIIAGAGTAGATLANLLSADGETSVLVIEGGDDRRGDPVVDNTGNDPALVVNNHVGLHYHYPVQFGSFPNHILGNTFEIYAEGRMWGGSSGHNFYMAVRGTPDVYNAWATETGKPHWFYTNLLPAMKYLEHYTPVGTPIDLTQRGNTGPLFITQDIAAPNSALYAAMAAVNTPYRTDFNNPNLGDVMISASQVFMTPDLTKRSYAASAFLDESVVDRCGQGVCCRKLTIASHALVEKVLIECKKDGPTAVGVRYHQYPADAQNQQTCDAEIIDVFADKIILCAGTMEDPQILQRSGIGPRAVLEKLGIDVIVDNPNVGRNIQNHQGPIAFFPMLPADPIPFSVAFVDLSGPHTGPATGRREFQFIFTPTGAVIGFNLRPAKVGTIEITSPDPTVPADIQLHLLEDENDIQKSIRALKVLADVSLAYTGMMPFLPPAALYPAAEYPGGTAPDDSALRAFVLDFDNGVAANHNSGSARMAANALTGVVDGNLDVFGVCNLSVASNSVVPEIETGNTAYQAYVIGMIKAKIEGACVPF